MTMAQRDDRALMPPPVHPVQCGYEMSENTAVSKLCGKTSVVLLKHKVTHATMWLCTKHASDKRIDWALEQGWMVLTWI